MFQKAGQPPSAGSCVTARRAGEVVAGVLGGARLRRDQIEIRSTCNRKRIHGGWRADGEGSAAAYLMVKERNFCQRWVVLKAYNV